MLFLNKGGMLLARSGAAASASGITVVGTFENSSNGASTTTVTLSGTAAGQVVYAFQAGGADGAYPSGYTGLLSQELDFTYFLISRKVLSGADTSIVFPANDLGEGVGTACGAVVLSGVNTTTPEDATTTSTDGSGQPNSPSITTVTNGALVISVFAALLDSPDATYTEPSGYTNKIDVSGTASVDSGLGVASLIKASAGAENPGAWSNVLTDFWDAASVAVRPA